MSYPRKTFHSSGSHISFIDVGSGPAVVLGHGFLCDADYWAPQIDALASHYRVVVPDLWGHGKSGPLPVGTVSISDVARHYLDLLDALNVTKCTIVGLSMGGMWGAELALMAPERVSGLVLMDTSLAAEPLASHDAYMELLNVIEQTRGFPQPVLDTAAPLFFSPAVGVHHPTLLPAFLQRLRAWDSERVVDSIVPLGRIIFGRREALADLAALKMPTLVATGAEDQTRTIAEGVAMAEQIGCSFIEIAQAGHTSNLEAPDAVNLLLTDFLTEQLALTAEP